jgi:rfaE bifunctional protein nucleotidyltransferase chain/domain
MDKILTVEQAQKRTKEIREQGKRIVVAGGCFDILHVGHLAFLEHAKKAGDMLFVLIESDETVRRSKGDGRPVNSQDNRALLLAGLSVVDFVVLLPPLMKNSDYDSILLALKPAIIATTKGDPFRSHKERQAQEIQATVIDVVLPISNQSTTRILHILEEL